ncbi:MAG: translation initiation factor IF-2 [candidate division WOR-3 bacterium]
MGKLRLFEAASQLNLSSEALLAILKELKFPHRGYTSYISDEEFEAARQALRMEKHRFKESIRRRKSVTCAPPAQPVLHEQEIARNVRQTLAKLQGREIRRRRGTRDEHCTCEATERPPVKITPYMTVAEVAHAFKTTPAEVIKKCMSMGLIATLNHRLDADTIALLADEFDICIEQDTESRTPIPRGSALPRPPVVVVMGHVDHGKTTLLDYIRKTKVAEQEAGRITQHIGAYVAYYDDKPIVFLDTPGHEAFTALRARGAHVTDIAVLVVAADEGMMPQTEEALDHARAARVPIIVAITKIDMPSANPERVKAQLAQKGIRVEGYGGDTLCVETSAVTGEGIEALLDAISVKALELNLKAPYDGPATGIVVEARVDKGRGSIATVLIQQGTLHRGDAFVAAEHYGRVRELLDDQFRPVEKATPSMPVQILGFSGLPDGGDTFEVQPDERTAREIARRRFLMKRDRILAASRPKITLEALQDEIAKGKTKELRIVLKTDVSGSAEALRESLEGLSLDEIKVRVIHSGVGPISRGDVLLAQASQGIVVGFNVRPLSDAKQLADKEGIEIRIYRIIYNAIDDIRAAMLGMLEPEKKEVFLGRAEVRQVFRLGKTGLVAGCYVQDGKVTRDAQVRVFRQNQEVFSGTVASLRRFKEDVKEVEAGYECGICISGIDAIQEGDTLELYCTEEIKRSV